MKNCIFCKIIKGDIPSKKVYEDDEMMIIHDVAPKAKLHYLCLPKTHFALLKEMDDERAAIVARCLQKISSMEETLGLQEGYRVIVNQGKNGGQTVHHLHIHLLGGEELGDF